MDCPNLNLLYGFVLNFWHSLGRCLCSGCYGFRRGSFGRNRPRRHFFCGGFQRQYLCELVQALAGKDSENPLPVSFNTKQTFTLSLSYKVVNA